MVDNILIRPTLRYITSSLKDAETIDDIVTILEELISSLDIDRRRLISTLQKLGSESYELGSTYYIYYGDSDTNGSWRTGRDGNNLVQQRRESGSWVTKDTITP